MYHILLVGLGGCLGAISRYLLGGWVLHHSVDWRFPLSTFVVNVTGCAVAGLIAGLLERHNMLSIELRLFLFTGVLGGFTTFSAFGVETTALLKRHEVAIAASYVGLSVVCGLTALWLCMAGALIGQSKA